jgi:hypothetical protein
MLAAAIREPEVRAPMLAAAIREPEVRAPMLAAAIREPEVRAPMLAAATKKIRPSEARQRRISRETKELLPPMNLTLPGRPNT